MLGSFFLKSMEYFSTSQQKNAESYKWRSSSILVSCVALGSGLEWDIDRWILTSSVAMRALSFLKETVNLLIFWFIYVSTLTNMDD